MIGSMIHTGLFTILAALQDGMIPIDGKGGVQNVSKASAQQLTNGLLNAIYAWSGVVCVLIIIIAGLLYATANGNAAQIVRARNAIIASVVGLVIVTAGFTITNFVIGKF